MDILDIIHDATKEANSFTDHPMKERSLEEQILYLNGLSLVMNADANIDEHQKEYLRILIKSFELDESCLNDLVAFAQAPDKDTIQAFFRTFRRKPLAQLFLYDAYALAARDEQFHEKEIAVVDKMAEQLEVLKGTQRDIFDLFCHIKHKDWEESSLYFSSLLLNPEHFKHLLDYYEVELEELLNKTNQLRNSRLKEELLSYLDLEWIPLRYNNKKKLPPQKEITKDFVELKVTYKIILPYLQSRLNRGELRVCGNKIFFDKGEGKVHDNDSVYIDLSKTDIDYDQVNRFFSVAVDKIDQTAILPPQVLIDFWNLIVIDIVPEESIGYAKMYAGDDDDVSFPKDIGGNYLKGEICRGYTGKYYKNYDGSSYVESDEYIDMSYAEAVMSGKIRLMR